MKLLHPLSKDSFCRCQHCCSWPVKVGHKYEEAICSFCDEVVEEQVIIYYYKVKEEVEELLANDEIHVGTGIECLNRMQGLFHPYDLTFMAAGQIALTDYIIDNKLEEALGIGYVMLEVCGRMARGSVAQVDLVLRMMRLQAELGLKKDMERLAKRGLSDAHSDSELCSKIVQFRRLLKHTKANKK